MGVERAFGARDSYGQSKLPVVKVTLSAEPKDYEVDKGDTDVGNGEVDFKKVDG